MASVFGWWRKVASRDPRRLREKAARLFGKRRWRGALRAYRLLADCAPEDPLVLVRLGDCARQLHRTTEAHAAWERAITQYAERSDWTKAAATCRLLMEVVPGDTELPLRLASFESRRRLGAQGMPQRAEVVLEQAMLAGRTTNVAVHGWSDERPHQTLGSVDFDESGRPLLGRPGARHRIDDQEKRLAPTRGAVRAPPPIIPLPPAASPDDAMPEEVFDSLYGSFSSAGAILRDIAEELETPSEADPEPCTCGRCHICRPETTRRFVASP